VASGTARSTMMPPAPPAPSESVEREQLIRRQLARTGLQVRLVDLASGIAVWVIGVLLLFMAAALFDHFVGLGSIGRCIALAVLVAGSLWFLAMQLGPLLVRSINPAYAARTIEEATPTLKNSLINFLLLRQDRGGLKEIVYQAVERQAATDIAAVPVEATVDRSRLIYAGYVLCGVMALFAAYKILSPKDPFQTVARVLAPWADIARPSRVQISEVEPGSAEVYHGQTVAISATVRGVRDGDPVKVLYSTADGQAVDQPVEMKRAAGDRYECGLPPAAGSGPAMAGGLLQDVTYRIVAGDAESFPYRLTVVSSPTIIVDRLEYQYPAYTKKAVESALQQGDIKALEGTKVTVHAVANQPIKSAWIEFDPTEKEAAPEIVPLAAEGQQARGTITLLLKGDRQTPWRGTYQVRFYNERGQRSQQPILHKIEVLRDLPPEVQLLKPERLRVEVPENGELTMELRGLDPDFGLSSLRIEGTAAGKPPLKIELLEAKTGQPPQITVPFAFRPSEHNLSAGDELKYAAVAEDNRTSPRTGQPEPNAARTKEYTLVIVPPQKNERGDRGGRDQRPMPGGENQDAGKAPSQPQANKADKSDQPRQPDQKNPPPMNDGQGKGEQQQPGKEQNESKDQQQPNQQGGDSKQQSGKQQSGKEQGDKEQSQPQAGQEQQSGGQASGKQQNDGQSGGQQQGQSGSKGSGGASQQANPAGGSEPSDDQNPKSQSGDPAGQGQNQGKADDGRAIEQIAKEMEKRGQQPQPNGQSPKGGGKQHAEPGQSQQGEGRGEQSAGEKSQGQPNTDSQEKSNKGQQAGNDQGGQPQKGGASGQQNQNVPNAGRPEGNDQQPNPQGKGERGQGKAGDADNRLPDDKEGQNPSEQPSGGNKGGAPRGPSKTDKGEKSSPSKGEQRDPGAGKNGDEGAGAASEDKSASGDGTKQNLDRNKEMKPDSTKAEKSEASPASSSKKQSDSKGGESGQDSGGGKKGAGQSAGQEGNDSAGSKSAADQGAGQANETGSGEKGTKAGQQQKAEGKTGQSGKEAGEGSGSQSGKNDAADGSKSEQQAEGDPAKSQRKSESRERSRGGAAGNEPVGGADDDSQRFQNKTAEKQDLEADAANLEYARQATEMALRRLKEEEHDPDPELLAKLGWTRDDLAEFLRRWEAMQKSASDSPAGKREMDEALKSLGLRDPANRRRAGGKTSDNQRGMRDAGSRSSPPPRYRELFDSFRKGAARSAQ
jgi:hypothetical protein